MKKRGFWMGVAGGLSEGLNMLPLVFFLTLVLLRNA